ncbi:MAG: hypothetical protein INQ03_13710 [Candidatus Heimdallarchaeota archaeon]|nr:hypothetical protein [Candidatus Heimdallarchaeota archaeon]
MTKENFANKNRKTDNIANKKEIIAVIKNCNTKSENFNFGLKIGQLILKHQSCIENGYSVTVNKEFAICEKCDEFN